MAGTADHIGIVGVGILGRGIAERLLERGFAIAVCDTRTEATRGLAERGARVCASSRELARHCDRVSVLVQNDAQCLDALCGSEGLLGGLARGAAVAIHSTVHPRTIARLAEAAARAGIGLIDAPLAGQGVHSLARGDFWMLCGGDEAVLERFRRHGETFCERLLHCGPLGSGATLKLAHNVATYIGYLAIVEADSLARAAGVREGALEAVTEASGTLSPAMRLMLESRERRRCGDPQAFDDERMQTYVEILKKDLRVAGEVARERGLELRGAGVASDAAEFIYGLEDRRIPPAA